MVSKTLTRAKVLGTIHHTNKYFKTKQAQTLDHDQINNNITLK